MINILYNCIFQDLCFVWNAKESHILAISFEKTHDSTVTKIIPTDTPLFDVEKVTLSCTGRWICLWGSRGATSLEIPRRSGKQRKFVGLDSKTQSIMAHTLPIAERFFMCNPKIMLQQVLLICCIKCLINIRINNHVKRHSFHYILDIFLKLICKRFVKILTNELSSIILSKIFIVSLI